MPDYFLFFSFIFFFGSVAGARYFGRILLSVLLVFEISNYPHTKKNCKMWKIGWKQEKKINTCMSVYYKWKFSVFICAPWPVNQAIHPKSTKFVHSNVCLSVCLYGALQIDRPLVIRLSIRLSVSFVIASKIQNSCERHKVTTTTILSKLNAFENECVWKYLDSFRFFCLSKWDLIIFG